MGPAESDRLSPRGGGHAYCELGCNCQEDTLAVRRAKELIAAAPSAVGPVKMAEWIGRATVVLQELTRDA